MITFIFQFLILFDNELWDKIFRNMWPKIVDWGFSSHCYAGVLIFDRRVFIRLATQIELAKSLTLSRFRLVLIYAKFNFTSDSFVISCLSFQDIGH